MSAVLSRPRKSCRSGDGLTTAPERRCEPGCFPFSSTATGTSPSRSRSSGRSSSSWPTRIAQASPPGPAPTISTPTSIRSSTGSVGAAIASATGNGGGKSAGRQPTGLPPAGADKLGDLRRDLMKVADDAEVGEVEDRRVRILVDGDDHAGALHPDLVLDRAGDAERDVELRRHRLARLPHL